MAVTTVTNASQLASVLKAAHGGDTIKLAAGAYGDLTLNNQSYSSGVTLASADPNHPAIFHSILLNAVSNLNITDVTIHLTPTATSPVWANGLGISHSTNISFTQSIVTGGAAINGVAPNSGQLDSTGNVKGFLTGHAIGILSSTGVDIESNTLSDMDKGVTLDHASNVKIRNNYIHDTRTGQISGGDVTSIIVDGNRLSSSHPWDWGKSFGDHGDFIHFWTDPADRVASANIQIINNIIQQGNGLAILGVNLEDKNGFGFTNLLIQNNAILNGNTQGFRLEKISNSIINANTLLQTSGDPKADPTIYLTLGGGKNTISNNIIGGFTDNSGSTGAQANIVTNNSLGQRSDPAAFGFYDATFVGNAAQLTSAAAIDTFATGYLSTEGRSVVSSVSYTMAPSDKGLTLTGTGSVMGVGDALNNIMTANNGADTLNGGAGADTMIGGGGPDTFFVDNTGDVVVPGHGVDAVISSISYTLPRLVDNLTLTGSGALTGAGNALNNVIVANDGADSLNGGAGADTLVAGKGHDTMSGGAGADTFLLGAANVASSDVVTDFAHGVDVLAFHAASYGLPLGRLVPADLVLGTHAVDHHAEFVFDGTRNVLMWDPDGSGNAAPVTVVTLTGHVTLTASDILILS